LPTGDTTVPEAPVSQERQVAVAAATRRAIDATLDRFVPAAVERHDPALGWTLAGPGLRAGTTRADWLHDRLPVYPFQTSDTTFHGWSTRYAYRDRVGFDLLLHARPGADTGNLSAITFTGVMRRSGSRWLVDSWLPVALYGKAGAPPVLAAPDYAPSASKGSGELKGRLGSTWLVVPLAILLGGIVLVPGGLAVRGYVRSRRARAAYRASGGGERTLPPLPRPGAVSPYGDDARPGSASARGDR
jgi:hypothetical protein